MDGWGSSDSWAPAPSAPSPRRFTVFLMGFVAVPLVYAGFAARHYELVAAQVKGLDRNGLVFVGVGLFVLALVAGLLALLLTKQRLGGLLAGMAVPAIVFAADVKPSRTDASATALSLVLAPVATTAQAERARAEKAAAGRVEVLETERGALRAQLEEKDAHLNLAVAEAKTARDDLNYETARLEDEVQAARQEATTMKSDVSRLTQQLAAREEANRALEQALKQALGESEAFQRALEKVRAESAKLSVRIADLEARLKPEPQAAK